MNCTDTAERKAKRFSTSRVRSPFRRGTLRHPSTNTRPRYATRDLDLAGTRR